MRLNITNCMDACTTSPVEANNNTKTKKEKEIYYHFRMIRDIANDEQKEKFEGILLDALRQGDQGNRPPPPNGQDGQRPRPPHPPKNK